MCGGFPLAEGSQNTHHVYMKKITLTAGLLGLLLAGCNQAQTSTPRPSITPYAAVTDQQPQPNPDLLCRDSYQRPDFTAEIRKLNEARQKWNAANVRNYSYEGRQEAPPREPNRYRVTVSHDQVTEVLTLAGDSSSVQLYPHTVEQMFDTIYERYQGTAKKACENFYAKYDAVSGYPVEFGGGSDYQRAADTSYYWVISQFQKR